MQGEPGETGPRGQQGPQGLTGERGPPGPPGVEPEELAGLKNSLSTFGVESCYDQSRLAFVLDGGSGSFFPMVIGSYRTENSPPIYLDSELPKSGDATMASPTITNHSGYRIRVDKQFDQICIEMQNNTCRPVFAALITDHLGPQLSSSIGYGMTRLAFEQDTPLHIVNPAPDKLTTLMVSDTSLIFNIPVNPLLQKFRFLVILDQLRTNMHSTPLKEESAGGAHGLWQVSCTPQNVHIAPHDSSDDSFPTTISADTVSLMQNTVVQLVPPPPSTVFRMVGATSPIGFLRKIEAAVMTDMTYVNQIEVGRRVLFVVAFLVHVFFDSTGWDADKLELIKDLKPLFISMAYDIMHLLGIRHTLKQILASNSWNVVTKQVESAVYNTITLDWPLVEANEDDDSIAKWWASKK